MIDIDKLRQRHFAWCTEQTYRAWLWRLGTRSRLRRSRVVTGDPTKHLIYAYETGATEFNGFWLSIASEESATQPLTGRRPLLCSPLGFSEFSKKLAHF